MLRMPRLQTISPARFPCSMDPGGYSTQSKSQVILIQFPGLPGNIRGNFSADLYHRVNNLHPDSCILDEIDDLCIK